MTEVSKSAGATHHTAAAVGASRLTLGAALLTMLLACGGGADTPGGGLSAAASDRESLQSAAAIPSILTPPLGAYANPGQTAAFTVTATGPAPLRYQWRRNGVNIAGATAPTYTTPALDAADDGAVYRVVVRNGAGATLSPEARLTVTSTPIAAGLVTQPRSVSVAVGGNATFGAIAFGTDAKLQWLRDGVPIRGATGPRVTLRALDLADSGSLITLRVRNGLGTVFSRPATLTVGSARIPPAFEAAPQATAAMFGTSPRFSTVATGTAPLRYQWFRNGQPIEGATHADYSPPAVVRTDDAARFRVDVSNAAGSVAGTDIELDVVNPPVDVEIASLLQMKNCNACHAYDSRLLTASYFEIGARYANRPSQLAYLTDKILLGGSGVWGVLPMPASPQLTRDEAERLAQWFIDDADPGSARPLIVEQPSPGSTAAGGTVTFRVGATGPGALSYQWRRNGVDIVGAIQASYTTRPAALADDGARFSVRVRNANGAVTSRAATLRVTSTSFPQQPITLVVPHAAGGPTDTAARGFAQALAGAVGQTVFVENIPGAGSTLGVGRVVRALPSGDTLLFTDASLATLSTYYRNLGFDPLTALVPLGLVDLSPLLIIGRPTLVADGIVELRDWMRSAGSDGLIGDAGIGSSSSLCRLLLQDRLGTGLTVVPYSGTAPLVQDVVAGVVDLGCLPASAIPTTGSFANLKRYGTPSAERFARLSQSFVALPSPASVAGLETALWNGLYAPAGTPQAVIDKLNAALRAALLDPEFRSRAAARQALPVQDARHTPSGHRDFVAATAARLSPLIVASGQYAD